MFYDRDLTLKFFYLYRQKIEQIKLASLFNGCDPFKQTFSV